MSLFNNRHIELTEENDLFGTVIKAKAIQSVFESYSKELGENKMFALYGGWGSGKSSVLKYLEKHLDPEKYETIFFDTWEYEKDDNLPLSLLSFLSENVKGREGLKKELLEASIVLFKSFFKGISIKLPGVEFSNEKYLKAAEDELKALQSFHTLKANFKTKFRECEDALLGKRNDKKIIIFIDDVDRCEPENVLNLISAIKLFFTYGKRVLFLFALDEEAVFSAIQTKYRDSIKADEYLEKLFDLTFYMPSINPTELLIKSAFPGETHFAGNSYENFIVIDDLFQHIKFNNPRHIKKVINKYKTLCIIKDTDDSGLPLSLIPNLLNKDKGNLQETIICLFFIIPYEYYIEEFEEIENYDSKIIRNRKAISINAQGIFPQIINAIRNKKEAILFKKTFNDLTSYQRIPDGQHFSGFYSFYCFLSLFTPEKFIEEKVSLETVDNTGKIVNLKSYEENILIDFCQYLIKYQSLFTNVNSEYQYWNIFQMCMLFL